jgi:hypothetical protein
MFEAVGERWKQYLSQVSVSWATDDVRHNLGGEVRERLRQLDLILKHLHAAIGAASPDPVEAQEKMAWALANRERLVNGEITQEEFIQGSLTTTPDPATLIDSWDDVSIFTEAFYHWAWRLIQVLTGKAGGRYKFPGGLGRVNVPIITAVRNHLIQHPERVSGDQNFTLGLVVTSSGPVLRSLGAVARGDSERIEPLPESVDQGLFVAAEQLRDELQRRFDLAISRTSGQSDAAMRMS